MPFQGIRLHDCNHREVVADMKARFPNLHVADKAPIRAQKVITTRGDDSSIALLPPGGAKAMTARALPEMRQQIEEAKGIHRSGDLALSLSLRGCSKRRLRSPIRKGVSPWLVQHTPRCRRRWEGCNIPQTQACDVLF